MAARRPPGNRAETILKQGDGGKFHGGNIWAFSNLSIGCNVSHTFSDSA